MGEQRWMTIAEAAEYARVSENRIRTWIDEKRLRAARLTARKGERGRIDRLVDRNDLDDFLCSLKADLEAPPIEASAPAPRNRRLNLPADREAMRAQIRGQK